MVQHLENYSAFRSAVERLRRETGGLDEFNDRLKHNPDFKYLKSQARAELQELYDNLNRDIGLVDLTVYLPARKKISVAGKAFQENGLPTEIRIYTIKVTTSKPHEKWTPRDLACFTEAEIFETFIHECAHVLEAVRHGRMGHGKPFIKAYENIEEYFLNQGYEDLIDPKIRLTGVPRNRVRK